MQSKSDPTQEAYGDLMTATLFILIIVLIAYVINFTARQEDMDSQGEHVAEIAYKQTFIINTVSNRLRINGINHKAFPKQGLIRLGSDVLTFDSGGYDMNEKNEKLVERTGQVLASIIPCYSNGASKELRDALRCTDTQEGQLHSIIIEGHTDNVPLRPKPNIMDNLDLSSKRAGTILRKFEGNKILAELTNGGGRPLFHVAGYGERFPVNRHSQPVDDPVNRRIDIRFKMNTPYAFGNS